ncbi:MAG: DUF6531 domain-containing protein, partial [Gammaproteobacteria bacterium]
MNTVIKYSGRIRLFNPLPLFLFVFSITGHVHAADEYPATRMYYFDIGVAPLHDWASPDCDAAVASVGAYFVATYMSSGYYYDNFGPCQLNAGLSGIATFDIHDKRGPVEVVTSGSRNVGSYGICREGYHISAYGITCYKNIDADAAKSLGESNMCSANASPYQGNPINVGSGNKYLEETDYQSSGPVPLVFKRYYNSKAYLIEENTWSHNYDYKIQVLSQSSIQGLPKTIRVIRPNKRSLTFYSAVIPDTIFGYKRAWFAVNPDVQNDYKLTVVWDDASPFMSPVISQWVLTTPTSREVYGADYEIISITDLSDNMISLERQGSTTTVSNNLGESFDIVFSNEDTVSFLSTPLGNITYTYNGNNIGAVLYPDGRQKQYLYEQSYAETSLLTGIIDERGIRYATYVYDSFGNGISSYHADDADKIDINGYVSAGTITNIGTRAVTNSRLQDTGYTFVNNYGVSTVTDISNCRNCGFSNAQFDYDEDANLISRIIDGVMEFREDYDDKGNPQTVTSAYGTSNAVIRSYTYDPRFQSKITSITEPSVYTGSNKITSYSYDDFGNTTSEIIDGFQPDGTPVSRTTTYTYNGPLNQLSEINGPRTNVTDIYTLEYYPDSPASGNNRARLKKITAPEGVVLYDNISYTATGNIDTYTGLNGLQVDMDYYTGNDRLELLTQTDAGTGEIRKTRWSYLATGEVETITQGYASPAATTITLGYDDARRLTRVYDGFSNYIEYTLDTEGNVLSEKVFNQSTALLKALNQTFDAYNRLDISTQLNETRNRDFAPDGTLDREVDGKNVVTDYSYDALRRLTTIVQDMGGAAPTSANALTQLDYDVQNNLVAVTDPNGGQTGYTYDDLGNLLSLSSPDTGTAVYTHDAAGNTITMTDAKGQAFSYTYDALGRRLLADAPGVNDDVVYLYDSCVNGDGKLCTVARAGAVVSYSYNAFGETGTVSQSVDAFPPYEQAVSQLMYIYDETGRLKDMMYPSGNKITYTYDMAGNVYNVILNDVEANLVTGAEYYPFGPPKLVTRGNATSIFGYMDNAYRTWIIGNGGYFYDIIYYDANGNPVTFYSSEGRQSHTYDALDRLDTSTGPYGTRDYD